MDITNVSQSFFPVDPVSGTDKSPGDVGINLAEFRHEGLYVSYETGVGYGVHVLNDGAFVVHAARSGRTRYFAVEDLIRMALAEGLDPAPSPEPKDADQGPPVVAADLNPGA